VESARLQGHARAASKSFHCAGPGFRRQAAGRAGFRRHPAPAGSRSTGPVWPRTREIRSLYWTRPFGSRARRDDPRPALHDDTPLRSDQVRESGRQAPHSLVSYTPDNRSARRGAVLRLGGPGLSAVQQAPAGVIRGALPPRSRSFERARGGLTPAGRPMAGTATIHHPTGRRRPPDLRCKRAWQKKPTFPHDPLAGSTGPATLPPEPPGPNGPPRARGAAGRVLGGGGGGDFWAPKLGRHSALSRVGGLGALVTHSTAGKEVRLPRFSRRSLPCSKTCGPRVGKGACCLATRFGDHWHGGTSSATAVALVSFGSGASALGARVPPRWALRPASFESGILIHPGLQTCRQASGSVDLFFPFAIFNPC